MADAVRTQNPPLLDIATVSHLGHARERNQDYFFNQPEYGLTVVADGVGGQGDGAWASRTAIRLVADRLDRHAGGDMTREAVLLTTLQAAHTAMRAENPGRAGKPSGTTIAGLWAPRGTEGAVTAFNVGDSPVLHFSDGVLTKVSRDHSLYQMWLDGGRIGREPAKRTIMQAIGISDVLSPHLHSFRVKRGDIVLICTDGLSGNLSMTRIAEILQDLKGSHIICESLLSEVLQGPAPDNITISVCCF